MNEKELEKRNIAKEVKSRIESGEPKQKIREELSQKYKDKATISKQLETTPSIAMKTMHRLLNITLIALLGLVLVVDSVMLFMLYKLGKDVEIIVETCIALNVVLDLIFLWGAIRYMIEIYSWIACRAVISLVIVVASNMFFSPVLVFVSLGLAVFSFFIGLLLAVKLFPKRVPQTIDVPISETETIKKTIYVFPD